MIEDKLQFDFLTTQRIIQKIGQIDQFKGEWKQLDKEENRYLKELRKIATIQSIGSSTRIEGSSLTDVEIATLIKNLKISKYQNFKQEMSKKLGAITIHSKPLLKMRIVSI